MMQTEIHSSNLFNFSKIDENRWGIKSFNRKGGGEGGGVRQNVRGLARNGWLPYYMGVLWRFLMMQYTKKILMCLSFLC